MVTHNIKHMFLKSMSSYLGSVSVNTTQPTRFPTPLPSFLPPFLPPFVLRGALVLIRAPVKTERHHLIVNNFQT